MQSLQQPTQLLLHNDDVLAFIINGFSPTCTQIKVWVKYGVGLAVESNPVDWANLADGDQNDPRFAGHGTLLTSNSAGDPIVVECKGLSTVYFMNYSNRGHVPGIPGMSSDLCITIQPLG